MAQQARQLFEGVVRHHSKEIVVTDTIIDHHFRYMYGASVGRRHIKDEHLKEVVYRAETELAALYQTIPHEHIQGAEAGNSVRAVLTKYAAQAMRRRAWQSYTAEAILFTVAALCMLCFLLAGTQGLVTVTRLAPQKVFCVVTFGMAIMAALFARKERALFFSSIRN